MRIALAENATSRTLFLSFWHREGGIRLGVLLLPLNHLPYRTALIRIHPRAWEVGELRGIHRKPRA